MTPTAGEYTPLANVVMKVVIQSTARIEALHLLASLLFGRDLYAYFVKVDQFCGCVGSPGPSKSTIYAETSPVRAGG